MKKVISQLKGGLGNQLFQYATSRAYAHKENADLILDISAFKDDKLYGREYLLDQFKLKPHSCFKRKLTKLPDVSIKGWGRIQGLVSKLQNIIYFGVHQRYSEEALYDNVQLSEEKFKAGLPVRRFALLPQFAKNRSVYLSGYWQSEEYFKEIAVQIREELQPKLSLPDLKKIELIEIQNSESVVIGVRRFSENNQASEKYFKLGSKYYEKAISLVKSKVTKPNFYIFTMPSDIEWAKQQFDGLIDDYYVITPASSNDTAWQDLYLMSQCQHFIISNSSFHWWGAWLSENPDKMVVAPKKGWGNERPVPESWQLID